MQVLRNPQLLGKCSGFKFYTPIAMLFIALTVVVNIVTQKVVPVLGHFILTVGDFIYPLIYMLSIILGEVYGYALSRRIIWGGWLCNLLAACIIWFAIFLPPASCWQYQTPFALILGQVPKIFVASIVAFLIGEFISIYVLAKLKIFTVGKFMFLRILSAIITGGLIDSVLFVTIAFSKVLAWHDLIMLNLTTYLFRITYQLVLMPVICALARYLKHHEGIDIFDNDTNFNPFKLQL